MCGDKNTSRYPGFWIMKICLFWRLFINKESSKTALPFTFWSDFYFLSVIDFEGFNKIASFGTKLIRNSSLAS